MSGAEPMACQQATAGTTRRTVLMNPGPVNTDERVRSALLLPDLCHREPEFTDLMGRVRAKTTRICCGGAEHTSVVLTGSGTAVLEATLCSVVPPDGGILVLDNGHYGQRMAAIVALHGIALTHLRFGWCRPIDLGVVEGALAADPTLTHVGLVHHETSTGMLNPAAAVGAVVSRHGRSLVLDAISSVGGELVGVCADGVDWLVGSANKCIEGMPGLGFVCGRRTDFEHLANLPARSYYLGLHRQYVAQEHQGAPAFTPAVQTFHAFDVALDLALAEGVAGRSRRYATLAARLRSGLECLGLRLLLLAEHRSTTLTAVHLPKGIDYKWLHDRLKDDGFVIYAGQDQLARKIFRLANMGRITAGDIDDFLISLRAALTAGPILGA